ncbi:MAG: beta strand repeat-containing protein, partial [Alphaproteobacteria bacterium]
MYRSVTKRLGWTTFFTPVLLASCGGGSDKQLSTTLLEGMTTGSNFGIVDGDDVFELDATSVRAAPDRPYYSEAADILGSGMLVAADAIFPDKSRDEITERLIVTAEQLDQSNWTERYLVDEDLLQPEMRALFVEAFSDEIVPTDEQLLKLDAVSRSIVLMNVELNEQRARGVEFDKVVLDLVHREFLNQVSFFMDEGAGLAYRFEGAAKAVYAQNIWSQLVYTDTALGVDRVVQPVEEVVEDQALTISGLFEIADASSQAYQFGISGVVSDNNIAILDSSIGRSTIMESTGLYSFVFDDAAGVVQALGEGQRLEVDVATFYAESAQGAADRLRQTLTVAVTGVNDAPEFSTDSQDLYFSGLSLTARPLDSVSGTLQATDVDQGDVVSFQIEAAQSFAEGVYTFTGLYGVLALNSVSGAFTYEVDPSLAGSQEVPGGETVTETVSIIVTDSSGATDSTTVTFAVAARNDEPTAVMSSVSQNEGVLASGTVVSEIELSSVDVFTDGSGNVLTAGSQYSYALTGSDAQDFEAVYNALTDKVLVRVKDGVTHTTDHEASSTLDINLVVTYDTNETVTFVVPTDVVDVNEAPSFVLSSQGQAFAGLSMSSTPLDGVSGRVEASDVDAGDVLAYSINDAGAVLSGSVYTFVGDYGSFLLNSQTGGFTYEVDPSLAGSQEVPGGETVTETVSIIVTDSSGATDSTTVTFAVAARNDEPTAVMSSVSQNEGVLASGTVVSEIELSSVDVFTDGSGNVLTAGSQYSYALTGSDAQDFEAVYNALTDKVLVRVKDGVTHTTDHEASSTLDINLVVTYDTNETVTFVVPTDVVDVNEAPVFGAQVTTHAIDVEVLDSIVSRLVAADVDAGDTLTYGIMVNGAAVLPNAGQSFVRITGTYGTMTLDTVTGSYTYRLLDNDADLIALLDDEDATDSFNLTVTDSGGLSATEAIDIVVTGKADNPTLTTTALSVDEQNGVQVFAEVEVLLTDAVVTPVYDDLVTFALNGIGTPFTDTSSPISVTWDNNTAEIKIDTTNLDADDPSTLPGQYELVVTYEGLEQVVTIPVTVLGLNDEAPVTLSTTVSLTEDAGTYNGQLRATDAENNVLEYQAGSLDNNNNFTAFGVTEGAYQTAGTYGVFRLNPDGFYSYELNNAAQALVPADANKFDSFTIRAVDIVNDVVVNAGNTATLRFDITGVQDEPVITFSAGSPVENVIGADGVDDVIVGTVVLTDVDTSVNAYSPSLSGTDAALFSVIDDGAGSFVVRLKNGNSFDYETSADRARDVDLVLTLGAETYTQAITYDLQDINEAFVLYGLTQSIGEADVEEAYGLVTTVNAGVDSDPEARVLSYIRVNETSVTDNDFFTDAGIARGDVATTPSSTWGVLDLNQNGEYSFTRNANVELLGAGETEHVYYIVEAEDSIGAIQYGLIDITVTGADDPLQVSFDHNGLAENSAVGTLVGAVTLTDVDRLDDVTQYDVTLSGVDAAKFSATQVGTSAVWNITVAANAVIDFEADNNLDITLVIKDETNAVVTPGDATQDDLVITVLDVDEAPIITSNIGSGLTYETNFYGNTGNNDGDYVIRLDENDLQASGFTGAIPVTNPDSFDVKIIPATTQTNGVDITAGNGNNTVVADMTLGGSTLGISLVLDEEGDFLATLENKTAPANASIMGKIEGLARGESYLDQLASGDIANTVGLPFEYVDVTVGPNGDTSPEAAKLFFDIIGSDDWQSLSIVFGDAQSGATIVNVGGAVNVDLLDGGTQSVTFANRQIQIDESATANNAVVGDLDILDDDDYTFAIKSSDLNKGVAVTADGAVSITSTAQLQTADAADGADDESVIITFEATNAFYGTADQNDQGLDGFSFQIQLEL